MVPLKKEYSAFLTRLLLFTLVLWAAFRLLHNSIPPTLYFEQVFFLLVFFFLTTALFHYGLLSAARSSNRNIVTYYMLSTAFKLLLYFGIIIGYALLNKGKAVPFIVNFFTLYVFFTVFEVLKVYRYFKGFSTQSGNPKP